MGLLNMFGLQKKPSNTNVKKELAPLPAPKSPLQTSTQQHFNEKMQNVRSIPKASHTTPSRKEVKPELTTVDLNKLNWKHIPGYEDWVLTEAQKLVEDYLSTTGVDGQLQVYRGGIIALDPLGRYFFPSMFFIPEYYADIKEVGFILDLSWCRHQRQVLDYIGSNVKRRDNLQFINFNPEEYRLGNTIKNPMSELFT